MAKSHRFEHTPEFKHAITRVFESRPPAEQQHIVRVANQHPDHPTSRTILQHVSRRASTPHPADIDKAGIHRGSAFSDHLQREQALAMLAGGPEFGAGKSIPKSVKDSLVRTGYLKHHGSVNQILAGNDEYELGENVPQGFRDYTKQALEQGAHSLLRNASAGDSVAAGTMAPAMFGLKQAVRPAHAVTTGIDALATGKGVGGAVSSGTQAFLHSNKAVLGSKLLADLGVKNKAVRAVGGLATDIAVDPFTWTSLGINVPAKIAAEKAAEAAAGDAARAAEHLGPRAAAQAESEAYQRTFEETFAAHPGKAHGTQLNFRAHVPFTKLTARASTPSIGSRVLAGKRAALGEKLRQTGPTSRVVRAVSHVNPNVRPPGFTQAQWNTIRQSARVFRGNVNARERAAMETAHGLNEQVPAKAGASFFAGLETIGPLTREQTATRQMLNEVGAELQARGAIRGQIGHGTPPEIPHVETTVADAQKLVTKAQRARVSAEKAHAQLREQLGVSKGRAQILSRNVGGSRAERIAEQPLKPRYQGGGHGVGQAHTALRASEQQVKAARQAVTDAHDLLEHAKTGAKGVRGAQRELGKFNRAAKGYVPHMTNAEVSPVDTLPAVPRTTGKGTAFSAGKSRQYDEPIHMQDNAAAAEYSTHPAGVMGSYLAKAGRRVEASDYWSRIAGLGKTVSGRDLALEPGEMVYKVDAHGLHPIESKILPGTVNESKVRRALASQGEHLDPADKFVVLPQQVAYQAEASIKRGGQSEHAFVRGYDKTLGQIKAFQTIRNPSYQLTNLSGDVLMARQGGATTADFLDAAKVSQAAHGESVFRSSGKGFQGEAHQAKDATVSIGGKQIPAEEIAKRFKAQGLQEGHVIDIQDVMGGQLKNTKLRRFNTARELFPRYASFIGALRRGMSDAEAARHVTEHHFDYSDLTEAERGLRRIIPFYTFAARNTKLQGKKLLTDPRVQSHFELAREESAAAAGKPEDWEKTLANYQQRGLPFALPGGLLLYTKSPITDLNQMAKPWDWRTQLQNVTNRTAPLLKAPFELATNRNFFFNEPINPNDPNTQRVNPGAKGLVPAPNQFGIGKLLEALHVAHPIGGTKQGQGQIPGWDPHIPYLLGQLPQTNYGQQLVTDNADPNHGITAGLSVLNMLTGMKTAKQDPAKDAYGRAIDVLNRLTSQLNTAKQRNRQSEAMGLQSQISAIQKLMPELRRAAGFKVKGRKTKAKGGVSFGGAGAGPKVQFGPSSSGAKVTFGGG